MPPEDKDSIASEPNQSPQPNVIKPQQEAPSQVQPLNPIQSTPPPITKAFPTKKVIAAAAIIIILIISLTVYWQLSKTPSTPISNVQQAASNIPPTHPSPVIISTPEASTSSNIDTSDWKEYVSNVNKISFKYPPTWYKEGGGDYQDAIIFDNERPYSNLEDALKQVRYSFSVVIMEGFGGISLQDEALRNITPAAKVTNIIVGGEPAIRVADKVPVADSPNEAIDDTIDVQTLHKGKLYEFTMDPSHRNTPDSRFPQFIAIFDKMLQTVKFLD